MKYSFLFFILSLGFAFNSLSQNALKNEEHCQDVISKKGEGVVVRTLSTFSITPLTEQQELELINLIYYKSHSTYNIIINGNIIHIYHISDISYLYLKEILEAEGYFIDFIRE